MCSLLSYFIKTESMHYFTWLFAVSLPLFSCNGTPDNILSQEEDDEYILFQGPEEISNNDVSIELSLPHGDSLRYFGPCWNKNPVDVIIRNNTDSVIHFYESWNSWGHYNFYFKIETADSTYLIKRTRNVWWRNFPSYHSVNPEQSLVFHFELLDSSCFYHDPKTERIRGTQQWTGFPQKNNEIAKIQVIYELPEEDEILINNGFISRDPGHADTTYIFSKKLISRPVDIQIHR